VIVLGKELRVRPDQARRELAGRAAAAALLHHQLGIPVLTVEGELRGASEPGSRTMQRLLADLGVPPGAVVARATSHATLIEVMTARVCLRTMRAASAVAVTSAYHVRRAQGYFDSARHRTDAPVEVVAPEAVAARAGMQRNPSPQVRRALDTIAASGLTATEMAIEMRTERILRAGGLLLAVLPRRLAFAIELGLAARLRGTPADLARLMRIARALARPSGQAI
jgi:uncharacterized SAM-binding protein YcdF (DUF218 family)